MAGSNLHDEIAAVLMAGGNQWLTTREIADQVNERNRYVRSTGETPKERPKDSSEISARINKRPGLFERDRATRPHRVRLRSE